MEKGRAIFHLLLRGEFEISDIQIKRLLDDVLLTAQRTIDELGLDNFKAYCTLPDGEDMGTLIPKSDADPYLKALGLPNSQNIIGRAVEINLKDDRSNSYTVHCLVKDYQIVRGFGIGLFFDKAEHIATPAPDCGVYYIHYFSREAAKKNMLAGKKDSWGALMKSVGTERELVWSATIKFLEA